jgi:putative flippase GtrA
MYLAGRRIAVRYPIIGFVNFVFSMSTFWILSILFENLPLMQLVLYTSLISIPISHRMQRTFVWTSNANYRSELLKFAIVTVLGTAVNVLLIDQFNSYLKLGIFEAQLVLSLLIIITTFVLNYFWTFKTKY